MPLVYEIEFLNNVKELAKQTRELNSNVRQLLEAIKELNRTLRELRETPTAPLGQ